MASDSESRDIVIIGGGIIGCTTAYFLTRHPQYDRSKHRITLLEASQIAGGASGKAGGLVALWAYPNDIVPLSFRLHSELAAEHDGAQRWGYRRIHVGQLTARARAGPQKQMNGKSATAEKVSLQKRDEAAVGKLRAAGIPADLDWFSADAVSDYSEMGDPSTTGQVHPYQFTTSMAQLAEEAGAKVVLGTVTKINHEDGGGSRTSEGAAQSVTYTDKETKESRTLSASDIVIAAGPWTRTVYPPAPIAALRAHSVTIKPSRPVSAYALFTEIAFPSGKGGKGHTQVTPEIYARSDEIYACGEGDTVVALPSTTADVKVDPKRCQEIIDHVTSISDELRDGEVLVRQACYLPNVEGRMAGPLIGPTGTKGLWLASGHTCWGICNAPATGKLMSEFLFDGEARSAKVEALDPRKALRR